MMLPSSRRRFLQAAAITGAAAAAAGCSQKPQADQKKQAQAANQQAIKKQLSLPSTGWERADYAQVAEGGTLVRAITMVPPNWNPHHVDGNEASVSDIYEPCMAANGVKADENGTITLDANYVEKAELISEEPQFVKVSYNKKAVWSTGRPVTIDDLISAWKALNGSNLAFTVVSHQGWESIKEIRKTSDFEGEIEFATPFPDWIGYVYPRIPQEVSKDPKSFASYTDGPVPTAGPFVVDSVDASGGVITLKRNPKWWGRTPKLDSIICRVTTQENMPSAFANGELDLIKIGDGDTYGLAKSRKDGVIQKSNGLSWSHVTLNVKGANGLFGELPVRKAIAYAIDREAVARAVVAPLESPEILINNFIYMPGQEGYEDSYQGDLVFDTAKAKKTLEDAGFTLVDGVYEKSGKKLQFETVVPAGTKSNEDRAKQIMTNLKAAGIAMTLKTVPPDKYFQEYVEKQNFSAVTFGWQGTLVPELAGPNVYLEGSAQNYTGFAPKGINELNARIQTELEPKVRTGLANELSKLAASAFTTIPLYATPTMYGLTKGFVNVGASQFENVDWTQVGRRQ